MALLLEQLMRLVYPERSPHDMHPGQWAALRFLARANREARTVAGLARYLGVTQGPASRAASALDRKGLIESLRDTDDRRVLRLQLTAAGRTMLAEDPMQRLASVIAASPASDLQALQRTLDRLFEEMRQAKQESGASFRLDEGER